MRDGTYVGFGIRLCAVIFSMAVFLGGCGKTVDGANISKGMELLEQYEYQAALESFETAVLYHEDMQLICRGEGIAYMGLGDFAQAESFFLESITYADGKLTDLEYDTNYYLAAAYMKQGKYTEAEEIYSAIISLRKKETSAYYLRGCVFLKKNDYESAIADFEKAFSLAPDSLQLVTDAYVEMQAAGFEEEGKAYLQKLMQEKEKTMKNGDKGIIYYYLEDYENARINLDAFLDGNDAKLSLILGKTYEKLGDMNYAAGVYQTYLDSNAPDAAIYNSLGICLMGQEKYEEALEAFEAGIDMGDSAYLKELKFNLIVANEFLGSFSKAKTMMEEYVQMYPNDTNAKREYEFLTTR